MPLLGALGYKLMFDHEHHQKILRILDALDPSIFNETGACFGGGTLISLLYGEYRWSKDVDFLCPVGPGYRRLREIVFQGGFQPSVLFAEPCSLTFPRDLVADQYGIRFLIKVDETPIKFEIIAEARIELGAPNELDWLKVPCLNRVDRYAEKLLANADRWLDSSIESRDLIDLAVLRLHEEQSKEAVVKAEKAYPVIEPLKKALESFQASEAHRSKCFNALQIKDRAMILDGIDLLSADFGLPKASRAFDETRRL